MEIKKLKIGGLYYVFNFAQNGKAEYVELCYYVGKGQYTQTLGFDMYPHKGDMFVPYGTEGIECAGLNTIYSHHLTKLEINPIDYRIDKGNYVDIPSEYLNEYDWWNKFVEKYNLA